MLISDSDVVGQMDLTSLDPDVPNVVASENIPLFGPGSVIRSAVENCGHELMARSQNFSGYLLSPGYNLAHVAAVQNIMSTAINRPRMRLNQIVAEEPDAGMCFCKRWIMYESLKELYGSAFRRFNAAQDRYQARMEYWAQKAQTEFSRYLANGVAVVLIPLPAPAAVREFNPGTFTAQNVTAAGTTSNEGGATYLVAITWTGLGYGSPNGGYLNANTKNNSESAPSPFIALQVAAGQVLTISIAGLNPPNTNMPPAIGTAAGLYTVMSAFGWNVYVGVAPGNFNPGDQPTTMQGMYNPPLYLQNATPIPLSTLSYTLPNAPVLSGAPLQIGQFPDYLFSHQRVLSRG